MTRLSTHLNKLNSGVKWTRDDVVTVVTQTINGGDTSGVGGRNERFNRDTDQYSSEDND